VGKDWICVVQNRNLAACVMGEGEGVRIGCFQGLQDGRGVKLTTRANLVAKLRISGDMPSLFLCFYGIYRNNAYLTSAL
jgi:hypothetical protein